ncbi:hypothetical protein ACFXHA_13605 [Nocardia sp. NPDC059240]|uniref:hypothetical protein n=1 Tax=Nocardia sp. NPDC059240 TaxID=3346786 RepID=UPI0036B37DD2
MIRVNRHIIAGTLLTGAVLLSATPAQAEVHLDQAPASEPQPVSNTEISSGSVDLNQMWCGTLWRPVCY